MSLSTIWRKLSLSAFVATLGLFILANGYSYSPIAPHVFHRIPPPVCGFPWTFYLGAGGFFEPEIVWPGLVADYLVAVGVSVVVSWGWKRVGERRAVRRALD